MGNRCEPGRWGEGRKGILPPRNTRIATAPASARSILTGPGHGPRGHRSAWLPSDPRPATVRFTRRQRHGQDGRWQISDPFFLPRCTHRQPLVGRRGAVLGGIRRRSRGGWTLDQREFDELTRSMASASTRRSTIKVLGGGALASLLALVGREAAAQDLSDEAVSCRATGSRCSGDKNCCSRRCTAGLCVCRLKGGKCEFDGRRRDKACCSGRCKKNGNCA